MYFEKSYQEMEYVKHMYVVCCVYDGNLTGNHKSHLMHDGLQHHGDEEVWQQKTATRQVFR